MTNQRTPEVTVCRMPSRTQCHGNFTLKRPNLKGQNHKSKQGNGFCKLCAKKWKGNTETLVDESVLKLT